jgi:hypothetical protein
MPASVVPACVANQPPHSWLRSHVQLLCESFERLVGRPLFPDLLLDADERVDAAHRAAAVLLSHGTEADPLFNYANQRALDLFELNWEQLCALPSRLSAEPGLQSGREALLRQVAERGFIADYSGVRVSRTGRRFRIERAVVWNLIDNDGVYRGQAATFSEWHAL